MQQILQTISSEQDWASLVAYVNSLPVNSSTAQERNEHGRKLYQACIGCHGAQGEGGFGPTIAGRSLTLEKFQNGLRRGTVMPMYPTSIITDREAADMLAYLNSLPPVTQRGALRVAVPESAPPGQRAAIATIGSRTKPLMRSSDVSRI